VGPAVIAAPRLAVVVLGIAFVVRERRTRPLLNLELFRIARSPAVVAVLLSYAMLYGIFFVMSFVLVRGYGDSPLSAGLHLVVIPPRSPASWRRSPAAGPSGGRAR
jgi:hypothetical protein